jgi:hypothetical protein
MPRIARDLERYAKRCHALPEIWNVMQRDAMHCQGWETSYESFYAREKKRKNDVEK